MFPLREIGQYNAKLKRGMYSHRSKVEDEGVEQGLGLVSCRRIDCSATSWTGIVPWAVNEANERDVLAAASVLLDVVYDGRVDEGRVGECPRLFETEDEDTRCGCLYDDIGIAKACSFGG